MRTLFVLLISVSACFGAGKNFKPNMAFTNSLETPASFADTFDRADADPMSTTSSSGGTWTSGPGAMNDARILVNNLSTSGTTEGGCRVLAPTFAANQKATMTFIGTGSQLGGIGVMVRMQGASDSSGYLASCDGTTSVVLYRVDDTGTFAYTQLGAAFTVDAVAEGGTMTLEISGTTLTLRMNGISQGTRTDSTYATGQPGTYFYSNLGRIALYSASDL